MHLTEPVARRLAWTTFLLCCGGYLLEAAVGLLTRVGSGAEQSGQTSWADAVLFVLTFAFPLAGVLVANRQPRNPIGWVMLAVGCIVAAPLTVYAEYGLHIEPGSLPAADLAAALIVANWALVLGLVGTYLILLFPDGHLPSPRWRPVGWFAGLSVAWVYVLITIFPGDMGESGYPGVDNPLGVPLVGDLESALLPTIIVLPLSFLLCAAGLVTRFRRSSGIERQQLKWLTTAGATVALLYLVGMIASLALGTTSETGQDPFWLSVVQTLAVYCFVLVPVAIGIAILKHGLYEIDVVINKALVLGCLASFITAVYVGIVVGVGRLAGGGDRPNLALSIAATAVVAIAFQPVRERVQRWANRLVYGQRATPYEVLSDFADRMGGTYDAADLLPRLARTVAQGVGAERVDVWLATGAGLVRESSWPSAPAASLDPVGTLEDLAGDRVVEVRHHGELLGAFAVAKPLGEQLTPAEDKLLDDVAAQAGLVLRNVRLIEDLRSSRQRLVTTADEERRRLERNLHDGAQQSLVSVALMINTARARLGTSSQDLGPALEQAASQLRAAIDELRELARGIHPAILTERGLGPALRSLAERSPVPVTTAYRLDQRPAAAVEATAYFVVSEALTNIAKYAHATQATVTVDQVGEGLRVEVSDDGIGGADEARGSGLRGLADRVAAVDGTIDVDSPPGRGTRLTCTIPLPTVNAAGTPQRSLSGSL